MNVKDIRPGDTIRIIDTREDTVVVNIDTEGWIYASGGERVYAEPSTSGKWTRTIELVSRPEPKLGSVWREPEHQWVYIGNGLYARTVATGAMYRLSPLDEASRIARLVPAE